MLIRKKYDLPDVHRLNVKFDMDALRKFVKDADDQWKSVYEANHGLCSTHPDLADNVYHHFDQISLTYFEQKPMENLDLKDLKEECRIKSELPSLGKSKVARYKTRIRRLSNLPPEMNEHNWYHPTSLYENSYVQKTIESEFESQAIRVRLVRLQAGKLLDPHIDYDATYAVRILVPIYTDEKVKNVFWRRGERREYYLPDDGYAYFLNVGLKHSVENHSEKDRLSLMFSLKDQSDIQEVPNYVES